MLHTFALFLTLAATDPINTAFTSVDGQQSIAVTDMPEVSPCNGPPSEACERALADAYESLYLDCTSLLHQDAILVPPEPPSIPEVSLGAPTWVVILVGAAGLTVGGLLGVLFGAQL